MIVGSADTEMKVALVAEIGNNHEGSISLAADLIEAAFQAGADAVKLQTFVPELYVSVTQSERVAMLSRFALPEAELVHLVSRYALEGGTVFSTPFDLRSLEVVGSWPLIKISSGDITFTQLISGAARKRRDMIVSTGACSLDEVQASVRLIQQTWLEEDFAGSLAVLHCTSAYPTEPRSVNLRAIQTLIDAFPECVIGYSDHTMGNDAAVAAATVGARLIEKHFTLDKRHSDFRDHALSATPAELAELRNRLDLVEALLGSPEKRACVDEQETRVSIRRSLHYALDLPPGTVLELEHIAIVRPGGGIPPAELNSTVGRRLIREAREGEAIDEGDLI